MSLYEFSLRQEILMEKGAAVLGDFWRYEWSNNISAVDTLSNPVVVMHDLVWTAKRNILLAKTEDELLQIQSVFGVAESFLAGIEVNTNA